MTYSLKNQDEGTFLTICHCSVVSQLLYFVYKTNCFLNSFKSHLIGDYINSMSKSKQSVNGVLICRLICIS